MKNILSHIALCIIALTATNMFFVIWLLIDSNAASRDIVTGLSFYQFFGITNGALLVICAVSATFKPLGDRILEWGYSNFSRFVLLIILSVGVFVLGCIALFTIHFSIYNTSGIDSPVKEVLNNSYFIALVFFFLLSSILMFFISNLERRSGGINRLFRSSMGNSLKPNVVQRGFVFIDLNNATTIAEKLGSRKYASLLRDCFNLLNELVALSSFEIYQFVGDEAVLVWRKNEHKNTKEALELFTDFQAYIKENKEHFANEYNHKPEFKCAMHFGTAVQSEIGKDVKHLVYHGDVLNTTSRLLSQCHINKTNIIISNQLDMDKETLERDYHLLPTEYSNLKGKEQTVKAYAIKEKRTFQTINHNNFFLTKTMTNSHSHKAKSKAMKTIRNLGAAALAMVFLASCGGDAETENQNPEQINQEQEQQSIVQTESNVQTLRKSDLKLQKIENGTINSYLPITGRVIPKNTTQLVAEVQGRIISGNRPFKAGTKFSKGQVLLKIDSREFALSLNAQKSAFLNILTGIMPDLKADYPSNYQNWLSYVTKYDANKPLPQLPETLSKEEKYFVTSNQVYNTYYNIKAQEERLSKFILRAPYSGSLSAALVDNGGLVSPGQPLGTFISDNNYELETAVNLRLAENLKLGQEIEFFNNVLNKTFKAKVSRINNIIDPSTQNIPVYLNIRDKALRSGMYLEGKVLASAYNDAVNIPATAINRDNTVHILKEGVIRKQAVEVVSTGDDNVIVKGIQNNTELVLNTFDNPVSGLKISQ